MIVPAVWREAAADVAQEGHLGVTKMKELLCSYAWWSGLHSDTEHHVKAGSACTVHRTTAPPAPLKPIIVDRPWQGITVGIAGPSAALYGYPLVTVTDYYSRYPFAFPVSQGTLQELISCLTTLFAMFGLPGRLVSENGTPFVSREFEGFLRRIGAAHYQSAVCHPQGNGTVERLCRTLKKCVARILEELQDAPFPIAFESCII